MSTDHHREIATLAGGCFWCLEALFEMVPGVEKVESGYTGGETISPTYDEVCSGTTGHAEAVRITFDPEVVSFRDLLDVFFEIHDPTTLNRQGADIGSQYRSVIFFHSPDQKAVAERTITDLEAARVWDTPVVTEVRPAGEFYMAEPEHHEYYRRNPNAPYCRAVIAPKVAQLRSRIEG
jgi:peptide-methionine (S)-S-oxide reductase